MKPISAFRRLTPGLCVWGGYDPECRVDCSSTAVGLQDGWVLCDPLPITEEALLEMVAGEKVQAILLTSGNHQRASVDLGRRLGAPIIAPAEAREELVADHWFEAGEKVWEKIEAIGLPGGATGETAFLHNGVLLAGDALINLQKLEILPDKYCTDPARLRKSLEALGAISFEIVCFAHGSPITSNARGKVAGLLEL